MAHACYDIVAVGVPHQAARAFIGDDDFDRLRLAERASVIVPRQEAIDFMSRFAPDCLVESGPVLRIAAAAATNGSRVAVLRTSPAPVLMGLSDKAAENDYGAINETVWRRYVDDAWRIDITTPGRDQAKIIHYGLAGRQHSWQAALLTRPGRLLCLEDRIWDAEGGPELAARMLGIARAAGRTTVLVCKDADCIFRNRSEIRKAAEAAVDYTVGDAEALLLLHDLQRFDSLVPRLRAMAAKAILWRRSRPPLVVEHDVAPWTDSIGPLDPDAFWDAFLPACIAEVARNGSLGELAGRAWPRQNLAVPAAATSGTGKAPRG